MSKPIPPARIAALRKLVEKVPSVSDALDVLEKETGMHRDSCRRLNREHRLYGDLNERPVALGNAINVLGDAMQQIRAKGKRLLPARPEGRPIRRLFIDLETSPNVCLTWRIGYKINLSHDNILKERAIICACFKWEGQKEVKYLHWDKDQCDKAMLIELMGIVSEADECVAHNGSRFDIPWLRTRCLFHGLPPFPDIRVIDTLTWCKKQFYFNSNRLDYVSKFLGIGGKLHTEFGLWKEIVLNRCDKSLRKMIVYCQHDIILLEKVWIRLAAVMPVRTHAGVLAGLNKWTDPRTGSTDVSLSKRRVTAGGNIQYQMKSNVTGSYYSISERAYQDYLTAKKDKRIT